MRLFSISSLLHAGIALVFSGLAYLAVRYGAIEASVLFVGPVFFWGKEMKEYQKWREKQGDGKDNVLQLKDLNPMNYNKGGRGDGTLDVLYPLAACVALGIGLLFV